MACDFLAVRFMAQIRRGPRAEALPTPEQVPYFGISFPSADASAFRFVLSVV